VSGSLDPEDWTALRALAHRALDETFDTLERIGAGTPWREVPAAVKDALAADPLPRAPADPAAVYAEFLRSVAPYAVDNRHPRFFGWVHGAGTPVGVIAELLAAGMNANTGGREHAAVYVERAVLDWWRAVFGLPPGTSGILTTGSSMANLIAVLVARRRAAGAAVRTAGITGSELVGYTSREAHGSLARAFDVAGLGSAALRAIDIDDRRRLDTAALRAALAADRAAGRRPFLLAATAGSAATGAVDDCTALAELAASEGLWFHVDGAFGALAKLSPAEAPLVAGIERADSLAFDFHKWLHVPYDAGAVLVRDGELHAATFADEQPYLLRAERGAAAGRPWFTDFGPELSRGFRALKVWFAMKTFGLDALGGAIARSCALARGLGERIAAEPRLELLAPVTLNIVCFRYAALREPAALDQLNARLAIELQTRGIAVPSAARIDGKLGLHVNVMNHRTTAADLDATLDAALAIGTELRSAFAGAS
jgi:glutamate/tyrosine decarboxylase-like PLP-dependent enzyme